MRRLCLVILVLFVWLVWGKGSKPHADAADYLITIDGGSCNTIGRWDATAHTCTLTGDVRGSLVIAANDITIDGDGFSVVGPGQVGIEIRERSAVGIKNLTITGWDTAIWTYRARASTFASTTLVDNGLGVHLMDSVLVSMNRNDIRNNAAGLLAVNSVNALSLSENVFVNNKVNVSMMLHAVDDLAIDTSNTLNGKPFYYFEDETGSTHNDLGEIGTLICVRCNDVTFDGLAIDGGNGPHGTAVAFSNSHDNTVRNALIAHSATGVQLFASNRNTFENTTFRIAPIDPDRGTAQGVNIGLSEHNVFLDNNFIETDDFSATSPVRMGNQNTAVHNFFFDDATGRGNYWSRFDTVPEGCIDADGDLRCDHPLLLDVGQTYGVPIEYAWTIQNGWGGNPQLPNIADISPTYGTAGTIVIITGGNFGDVQNSSIVTFNSTEAVVLSWSDAKIEATVPSLATGTYNVVVVTDAGNSNAVIFEIIEITDPVIFPRVDSISPSTGSGGTLVTISGEHFGERQGTVTFSSQKATVLFWNPTLIELVVPELQEGMYDVKVTNDIGMSNSVLFEVMLFSCSVSIDDESFYKAFKTVEKFVKKALGITTVAKTVLEATLTIDFDKLQIWQILLFAAKVDDVLDNIGDNPIDKINHINAVTEFAQFTADWGFTTLLSSIGLTGISALAELATLPIISSLYALAKTVDRKALSRQVLLYTRAREVRCTLDDIVNQRMCTDLAYDDHGWIFSANIKGDKIEKCNLINTCIGPSPLVPLDVFEYAEFLFKRNQFIADFNKDLLSIKKVMEDNINFCKQQ